MAKKYNLIRDSNMAIFGGQTQSNREEQLNKFNSVINNYQFMPKPKPKINLSNLMPAHARVPMSAPKVAKVDPAISNALNMALATKRKTQEAIEQGTLNPEFAKKHPYATQAIVGIGNVLNAPFRALESIPFAKRVQETAGQMVAPDPNYKPTSTGNTAADIGASLLGTGLGALVPGGALGATNQIGRIASTSPLATRLLSRLPAKATGTAAQVLEDAIGGAAFGLGESTARGDRLGETAKNMLIEGAMDVGGGALIRGSGKALGVGQSKLSDLLQQKQKTVASDLPLPEQILPNTPKKFTKSLTAFNKAQKELNEGIEAIQNYIGHKDVLAAYPPGTTINEALTDAQKATGVDLTKLAESLQKAELKASKSITELPKMGTEKVRLGYAAGVLEPPNLKRSLSGEPIIPQLPKKQADVIKSELNKTIKEVASTAEPLKQKEVNQSISEKITQLATNWKDKSKLALKRETMERNIEDIAGKDAPIVKKYIIEPVKNAEADRIRWLNKERQEISSLGIKPRSKDSKLLQQYGEGVINLDQLKKQTPNWQKIEQANKVLRQKYDTYLENINKVLERHGYDPIPRRKDYFRHFTEVNNVIERFGIPIRENKLPTDINGLTADFRPGKNFFASALERKGNTTDFDAIQGIDGYIEGASKLIYHTENIQRLRSFDKALREKFKDTDHLSNFAAELTEYTNILAGKKAMIDRAAEDLVGRNIYGAVDKLRKQVGANMVGANVSSALTNFIPLTQSLATTDKPSFVRGMAETIANIFKNDGFIDKSDFLTRRIGSDRLSKTLWEKTGDVANWMFKIIDDFTAQTIVRSKYLEGLKKGLNAEEALKQADDWAARIMADRSLGTVPTLFSSKTLGPLTQFQLEVNNQLSFIFKDIPRTFDKAAAASALGQLLIYGYIFNNLFEKATGRRPAFDLINIVQEAYNDYTKPKKETTQANKNLIDNIADQVPFLSTFTGGGRIPLSSALPDVIGAIKGDTTWSKEMKKPLFNLLPPTGGGQIRKTFEGLKTLQDKGVYNDDKTKLKYPVDTNTANVIRAVLFGKSALPETREYYDNNRIPLGEKQTKEFLKKVQSGKDAQKEYAEFLRQREIDSLEKKIKDMRKEMVKNYRPGIENEIKALQLELERVRKGGI